MEIIEDWEMWHIIAPASLRRLSKQSWDAPALKKKAKAIYRQMVKRTLSIGGLCGNSLHICRKTFHGCQSQFSKRRPYHLPV